MIFLSMLCLSFVLCFPRLKSKDFLVGSCLIEPTIKSHVIYMLMIGTAKNAWPHTTSIAGVLKVFCSVYGFWVYFIKNPPGKALSFSLPFHPTKNLLIATLNIRSDRTILGG